MSLTQSLILFSFAASTRIGFDAVPSTVREGKSLEVCVSVLEGTLLFDYEIEITFGTTERMGLRLRKRQANEGGLATCKKIPI